MTGRLEDKDTGGQGDWRTRRMKDYREIEGQGDWRARGLEGKDTRRR